MLSKNTSFSQVHPLFLTPKDRLRGGPEDSLRGKREEKEDKRRKKEGKGGRREEKGGIKKQ